MIGREDSASDVRFSFVGWSEIIFKGDYMDPMVEKKLKDAQALANSQGLKYWSWFKLNFGRAALTLSVGMALGWVARVVHVWLS